MALTQEPDGWDGDDWLDRHRDALLVAGFRTVFQPPASRTENSQQITHKPARTIAPSSMAPPAMPPALHLVANRSSDDTDAVARPTPSSSAAAAVRRVIRARRLRDRYFPPNFFADPVWDILLDLTAARLEGKKISVSSLCIAANVPQSTAFRIITQLCDEGVLIREKDARDNRRSYVELSDATLDSMLEFFNIAQPGGDEISGRSVPAQLSNIAV